MPGIAAGLLPQRGIRKRRSSIINPLAIPGLQAWFKADAGLLDAADAPITVDGTAIKTWQDQSGNARHATQATAGSRPLAKLAIQNGRPVVRFDGVDDALLTPAFTLSAMSVICVGKFLNQNTKRMWARTGASAQLLDNFGPWNYFSNQAAGSVNLGGATNSYTITSIRVADASTALARRQGQADTAFDPADNFSGSRTFALGFDGASNWGNVETAEILVYDSSISDANLLLLEAYLKTKWGTS